MAEQKDWVPNDWTLEQTEKGWSLKDKEGDTVLRGETYENVREQLRVFYKLGSKWALGKMLEAYKKKQDLPEG